MAEAQDGWQTHLGKHSYSLDVSGPLPLHRDGLNFLTHCFRRVESVEVTGANLGASVKLLSRFLLELSFSLLQ